MKERAFTNGYKHCELVIENVFKLCMKTICQFLYRPEPKAGDNKIKQFDKTANRY